MDVETKKSFERVEGQIEKLATMVAEGFADVNARIDAVEGSLSARIVAVEKSLSDQIKDLWSDIKSVRHDLERLPDEIDKTYATTINDLFDRVTNLEKRLATLEAGHA